MATGPETIPEGLRAEVDAALRWFNNRESEHFEITEIPDLDVPLATEGPKDLAFVLPGLRWVSREFQNAEGTG